MKVTVHAGSHNRNGSPLSFPMAGVPLGEEGKGISAQVDSDQLVFIPPHLELGTSSTYSLIPAKGSLTYGVHLEDTGERICIKIDGELFTNYFYKDVPARPYFWPVNAPGQVQLTRAYPMANVEGETQDHHHHRSIYFAYGEVNEVDNWSEEKGHGYTVHKSVDELVSGPVFGRFVTTSDWTSSVGETLMSQKATVTVYRGDDKQRMMDVELSFTANEHDVHFGDTKEGGIISVRVASVLDVDKKLGGIIVNAYGGINERETWGKAAHWCDYSGNIDGHPYGIAVMDHPSSFRYPTYWHVRDYGLMTANPFALAAYTAGEKVVKDGSYTLKVGEQMHFKYRVLIHRGNAYEADVTGQYLSFVSPPKVVQAAGEGNT